MSSSRLRERLAGPTREALARYERHQAETAERQGRPPRPGEVFAFAETAEDGVLWVVLDQVSDGAWRVVAADVHFSVGSRDVALPDDADCGALVLRCGIEARLGEDAFATATRAGFVDADVLARARQKRADVDAGAPCGSELERETDLETDYRHWLEDVQASRDRLASRWARPVRPACVAGARRPALRPRVYGLAASVLLVVTLGLVGGLLRQEEAHERELAEARSRIEELERELGERPPAALSGVNVAFRLLYPKRDRGHEVDDGDRLDVPPVSDAFFLVLFVEASYPEYRLEIRESGTDRVVWSRDALTRIRSEPVPGSEAVTVTLPRSLLPPGDYWLVLDGLRGSETQRAAEYGLRVMSP